MSTQADTPAVLDAAPPAPMHPLERYTLRHAGRPANQTPDGDLLLLSIAQDTHEMLLMARENQEYIRVVNDMQRA